MKTLLICHEGADLDRVGLARWMASFSDLAGIVVLNETKKRGRQRIRREIKRVGLLRFLDVLAFRFYYKFNLQWIDRAWEERIVAHLCNEYTKVPDDVPVLMSNSVNNQATEEFIRNCAPDVVIARCKTLIKQDIFEIANTGTFVMQPGMCPEYRNAHGCFWALANDDINKVAMTLLKIDRGVDTGPTYGYFTYNFDEVHETHNMIQARTVLDNLDAIAAKLEQVHLGTAETVDTSGRESDTWGQPWLTKYFRWKRMARHRAAQGILPEPTPVETLSNSNQAVELTMS